MNPNVLAEDMNPILPWRIGLTESIPCKNHCNHARAALHAMMKANKTFLVGFRHISVCGSRIQSRA
jgi:hypothetical protein